jgi:hypothetical protein
MSGELQAVADGESLYVKSPEIDRADSQIVAEWAAYELVRLMAASAYLHFGTPSQLRLVSVQKREMVPLSLNAISVAGVAELRLSEIIQVGLERQQVRKALLAHAAGGAAGLFEAYEAVTHEVLNCGVLDFADVSARRNGS